MCVCKLQWEICHRFFHWDVPKFFRVTAFQITGQLLPLYQKLLLCLYIPCSISFKILRLRQIFCTWFSALMMKNYLIILKSKKFWFKNHVISWDKFDKTSRIIFERSFYFDSFKLTEYLTKITPICFQIMKRDQMR